MRALSKHFPELCLSYASVHNSCRRYQRMPQPFRQVAAKIELYFRVCLSFLLEHLISLPHLRKYEVLQMSELIRQVTDCPH
jgi:hypothetical protein